MSIKNNLKIDNEYIWKNIPKSIKTLHNIFNSNNKNLYLVGGSIRDLIIGNIPIDYDLCTNANPDEIINILKLNNYEYSIQGKSFGVVVVYTSDQPSGIEIVTFRTDIYNEHTKTPRIIFTNIEDDVMRRDIRINGLYYDLNEKVVIDLVGGIEDLKNNVISMIGDPNRRIEEDPLRILRVLRMSSRF